MDKAITSTYSLQEQAIGTVVKEFGIGGLSLSTAELVSLLGNTWWLKAILWGTTMGVIVSVLIRLLLPSVDFNPMYVFTLFLINGLIHYFGNHLVLSRGKQR